jgi:iron complex outermembrane receptor protein
VNATGFYQDIEDKQVSDFRADPTFGAVTFVNNADQEMWGAEVEAAAVPIDNLNLRLAYALLRPEYTRFIRNGVDVTDTAAFVNSPEHTINVAGAYSIPTDYGVFTIAADGYWQDDEDYLLFDNEFIHASDYFVWNGRLQMAEIPMFSGYLDLSLWGRNLFDRKYKTFGIDFGDLVGVAGNTFGKRRTFGFDVTWRWGMES